MMARNEAKQLTQETIKPVAFKIGTGRVGQYYGESAAGLARTVNKALPQSKTFARRPRLDLVAYDRSPTID